MACRGVHFSLSEDDVAALVELEDEQARLEHLQEVIEERYMALEGPMEHAAESDKAWDGMHRLLADGQLSWDGGTYPLNHTVLGGELLYTDSDYIMSLKTPDQVREISRALDALTDHEFARRYRALDADACGWELGQEDLDYTWSYFQEVRELYRRAAVAGRYVLFSADQ